PSPRNRLAVEEPNPATARSRRPSPLKSAAPSALGAVGAGVRGGRPTPPVPSPRRMTRAVWPSSAPTPARWPSPFASAARPAPALTPMAGPPREKGRAAWKNWAWAEPERTSSVAADRVPRAAAEGMGHLDTLRGGGQLTVLTRRHYDRRRRT